MSSAVILLSLALAAGGHFVDERDGKRYRTMRVGNLEWMRDNLAFSTPESWCYGDEPKNCGRYGRLYRFAAARTACPSGWRLPSDEEWMELERWAGMSAEQLPLVGARGKNEGARLRTGGDTGFDLLMGGYRERDGSGYTCAEECAALWSSSTSGDGVWHRDVRAESDRRKVWRSIVNDDYALSVRCVRGVQ